MKGPCPYYQRARRCIVLSQPTLAFSLGIVFCAIFLVMDEAPKEWYLLFLLLGYAQLVTVWGILVYMKG